MKEPRVTSGLTLGDVGLGLCRFVAEPFGVLAHFSREVASVPNCFDEGSLRVMLLLPLAVLEGLARVSENAGTNGRHPTFRRRTSGARVKPLSIWRTPAVASPTHEYGGDGDEMHEGDPDPREDHLFSAMG